MPIQVSTQDRELRPSRLQSLQNKVFSAIYERSLLYNTCWEDPRVDHVALQIQPGDNVVVITSAGCNVLDYAIEGPATVHAVDANPRQTALLELKLAGIRALEHAEFFEIFGTGRSATFRDTYKAKLRDQLTEPSQKFWDKHQHWFKATGSRGGFYYRGLSGMFARLFTGYLRRRPRLRKGIENLLETKTLEEQREVYAKEIEPIMFSRGVKWVLDRQATMNLLGVPASQRLEVQRETGGGVSLFIQKAISNVCTQIPFQDNYFWQVYLRGRYTEDCCPRYLTPEGFQALKDGRVDCVKPHTNVLTEFLKGCDDKITQFVLLDHMDWMAWHDPKGLEEEWGEILGHAADDVTIIFRSGAAEPEYLHNVQVEHEGQSRKLDEVLTYDPESAARLHVLDRVGTYAGFHIASLTAGSPRRIVLKDDAEGGPLS